MLFRLFLFCLFLVYASPTPGQKGDFRLLSYNIRNGKGMDGKTDFDRTAALLKGVNANVIALQEVDSVTKRSNGISVLAELEQRTSMHGVFGAAIPYLGGSYGVGV